MAAIHVVSRIEIDYRQPARASDILRFETEVAAHTVKGFRMDQNVLFDESGASVLNARVFNVFVDHRGRPKEIDDSILDIWPDLAGAKIMEFKGQVRE